jgi:hypothetical protein
MGRRRAINRSRRCRRIAASWLFALVFGVAVGGVGLSAGAVESPAGSKNFTAPRYVPNYFSNESGAFTGAIHRPGVQPSAPVYAAPRAYPRPSYGYAAASRRAVDDRRYTSSRRRYHHLARGRLAARRHFIHVAARGHRHALHARPAANHRQRAVRFHASSAARTKRIARAGH